MYKLTLISSTLISGHISCASFRDIISAVMPYDLSKTYRISKALPIYSFVIHANLFLDFWEELKFKLPHVKTCSVLSSV